MANALAEGPKAETAPADPGTRSLNGSVTLVPGVTREFLLHHRICPLRIDESGMLHLAIAQESVPSGIDDLEVAYQSAAATTLVSAEEMELLIERLATTTDRVIEVASDAGDGRGESDVRDLANQPPVVRYVNLLIREAIEIGASDIHLESSASGLRARLRLDGMLVEGLEPPSDFEQPVISRVKLLADLDIANRRHPQDGRIRVRLAGRSLEMRVSTVPTLYGESVVMRLLDRAGRRAAAFDELGLDGPVLEEMRRVCLRPHGMVLVTGPTGSGKTTTLYAALSLRDSAREKIITVEDPVEHAIEGAVQVPVHAQANVGFASVLRSMLRQDPDVLMIGEMRDSEAAEIAVKASLTGHLVLSTLHTNSAVGAIPRLLDMGLEPFIVAGTLEAVLAQRLVRRICDGCRSQYEPALVPADAMDTFRMVGQKPVFTQGTGCTACWRTGFRGRIGLFELLVATPSIREAIASNASREIFEAVAAETGMTSLRADGWIKVLDGHTTIEEVLRVTA